VKIFEAENLRNYELLSNAKAAWLLESVLQVFILK